MKSLPSLNSPYTYFHQLFFDPLVFVVSSGLLFDSGVKLALDIAKGKSCFIVVQPSWNIYSQFKNIQSDILRISMQNKHVQFMVICPSLKEVELLSSIGVDALHVHKNSFIDEKIFSPIRGMVKKFSAVHIANIEKFKRHYLAWDIENIAVLTYSYVTNPNLNEIKGYKHLSFGNFKILEDLVELDSPLPPEDVNRIICESNCGLILSAEEGTNNASTEYLLSGVPVISTSSKGGREELFDERYVLMVEPNANAIQLAVKSLQKSHFNPLEIRENVLIKIRQHRMRFLDWLCDVTKQDLYSYADQNYWIPHFVNKLRQTIQLPENYS